MTETMLKSTWLLAIAVRAVAGGRHPHLGTQNALVALGRGSTTEHPAPR
jgi:hypothetical protein